MESASIFNQDFVFHIFRWIHFMAGIVWIGMLYYFNFVQGAFFNEADGQTKSACIRGLVPRALWWFRWGAMFTFLSGIVMLGLVSHGNAAIFTTSYGVWILIGSALGTIMFLNVWLVIWPNQKIVIASAQAVASGGQADPNAAGAASRAGITSRTNVLFSIPMLFMMGASRHLPLAISAETNWMNLILALAVIIGLLEANALFGKMGPLAKVAGVIHLGLVLTAVIFGVTVFLV